MKGIKTAKIRSSLGSSSLIFFVYNLTIIEKRDQTENIIQITLSAEQEKFLLGRKLIVGNIVIHKKLLIKRLNY